MWGNPAVRCLLTPGGAEGRTMSSHMEQGLNHGIARGRAGKQANSFQTSEDEKSEKSSESEKRQEQEGSLLGGLKSEKKSGTEKSNTGFFSRGLKFEKAGESTTAGEVEQDRHTALLRVAAWLVNGGWDAGRGVSASRQAYNFAKLYSVGVWNECHRRYVHRVKTLGDPDNLPGWARSVVKEIVLTNGKAISGIKADIRRDVARTNGRTCSAVAESGGAESGGGRPASGRPRQPDAARESDCGGRGGPVGLGDAVRAAMPGRNGGSNGTAAGSGAERTGTIQRRRIDPRDCGADGTQDHSGSAGGIEGSGPVAGFQEWRERLELTEPTRYHKALREAAAALDGVPYFLAKDRSEEVLEEILMRVWSGEKQGDGKTGVSDKIVAGEVVPDGFQDWRNQQYRFGSARSIQLRIYRETENALPDCTFASRQLVLEMVDAELLIQFNERDRESPGKKGPQITATDTGLTFDQWKETQYREDFGRMHSIEQQVAQECAHVGDRWERDNAIRCDLDNRLRAMYMELEGKETQTPGGAGERAGN